jgi:hypothetical protein
MKGFNQLIPQELIAVFDERELEVRDLAIIQICAKLLHMKEIHD